MTTTAEETFREHTAHTWPDHEPCPCPPRQMEPGVFVRQAVTTVAPPPASHAR